MHLADRWPLPQEAALRDALLAAYADPARRYHDTRHLTEVLDRLDELPDDVDRLAVTLAAWFHDSVYDGEPGAEERSAQWAATALAGHDPDLVAEVVRLVRLTEAHDPAADDRNGSALVDADLAILATSPERYAEYAAAVRAEYAHVPDDAFRAGRTAILTGLLDRDHLFHTAYAREHWEAAARRNVTQEVAVLAARGGSSG